MTILNSKQWKELLKKAKKGDDEAQWEAGSYYEDGLKDNEGNIIIPQKPKQAYRWYLLSAEQGNESSQVAIGNLLSIGRGVKQDFSKAIYWTKKAIKQGLPHAAHNLATIYRDMEKPNLSFKWYSKAVEMGDNDALLDIGLCQLFGYGIKQNFDNAYKSFEKTLEFKYPTEICQRTIEDAQYWLGVLHLLGIGKAKKSIKKSRVFLELANKDDDHEQANNLLNLIGKTTYIKT